LQCIEPGDLSQHPTASGPNFWPAPNADKAVVHQGSLHLARAVASQLVEVFPWQLPEHAQATTTGTSRAEKALKIGETIRSKGRKG